MRRRRTQRGFAESETVAMWPMPKTKSAAPTPHQKPESADAADPHICREGCPFRASLPLETVGDASGTAASIRPVLFVTEQAGRPVTLRFASLSEAGAWLAQSDTDLTSHQLRCCQWPGETQ